MAHDMTLDSKEETRFRNKFGAVIKDMTKKTNFSLREVEALSLIYCKLQKETDDPTGLISRRQFRQIIYICFDMPEDGLIARINVPLDKGMTPFVTLETWLSAFNLWLRGTLDMQINYCFAVYDVLGENLIKRDFMIQFMRKAVIKHLAEDLEEAVKDLVDLIIKRMDLDRDGAISYTDFRDSVRKSPELLQCFGQCLPARETVYAFTQTFTDKIRKF